MIQLRLYFIYITSGNSSSLLFKLGVSVIDCDMKASLDQTRVGDKGRGGGERKRETRRKENVPHMCHYRAACTWDVTPKERFFRPSHEGMS
jgi:hypothetical protein